MKSGNKVIIILLFCLLLSLVVELSNPTTSDLLRQLRHQSMINQPTLDLSLRRAALNNCVFEDGRLISNTNDAMAVFFSLDSYIGDVRIRLNKGTGSAWPLQVFYDLSTNVGFNQKNSVLLGVKANQKEITLAINKNVKNFRVDFGCEPNQTFYVRDITINPKPSPLLFVIWRQVSAYRIIIVFLALAFIILAQFWNNLYFPTTRLNAFTYAMIMILAVLFLLIKAQAFSKIVHAFDFNTAFMKYFFLLKSEFLPVAGIVLALALALSNCHFLIRLLSFALVLAYLLLFIIDIGVVHQLNNRLILRTVGQFAGALKTSLPMIRDFCFSSLGRLYLLLICLLYSLYHFARAQAIHLKKSFFVFSLLLFGGSFLLRTSEFSKSVYDFRVYNFVEANSDTVKKKYSPNYQPIQNFSLQYDLVKRNPANAHPLNIILYHSFNC